MGSLGTYKGVEVYEVGGQYAAIKESLENPSIITCYWITSTRAKMYRHGVPFGELVDTGDDILRVELLEEKKKEEPKKAVSKEVPKEEPKESTVPTSIDEYFVEAKRNIDDILNGLLEVKY
jgi:hypothetical protein